MYHLKILQLVGIREYKQNHFLQINVQLDQKETFYWKIDEQTANNLLAATDFTKEYYYRLSFKTYLDKSIVTRTQLEESLNLEFTCSSEYIKQLAILKQVESLEEIKQLEFLSSILDSEPERENTQKMDLPPINQEESKRQNRKPSWFVATAFTVIFAIIFTYTGHSILTKALAQPEKVASEHDLVVEETTPVKEKVEPKPETIILEDNITIEEKPAIPLFELENGTSHGIPEGKVALTFDDGPSQFTDDIIDILKASDAGGTFFLIGSNVNKFPENAAYIHENGYSIGNHSMNHINFASSGVAAQQEELLQSSALIEEIIGEDITLFRPPFGKMNGSTEQVTKDLGQRIVLWNNDPKDWQSRDTRKIINHIKSTEVSGSIILLHETKATLDALPEIIAYLKEQDLELVTLR
ncbi:polysaccharide deacetylase family protein [Paucisalibacillus sp. EB02]|uniref:polysaccharide deacetylase family protein n=1 Tax=Paucisalibacillus sp. EB02 TaxID=1347087 RepID=UPI0004B96015|nr:polysaccharide deacetylase family protein [Paucisalibacillus sp. EB02]